jgi:hypothetical protein
MKRLLLSLFCLCLPALAQRAGPFSLNAVGTSGVSSCATISVNFQSNSTVYIDVSGTFSATLQPAIVRAAPGTARNVQVTPVNSTTQQSTITTGGGYWATVTGADTFQACVSSYASGTAVVYLTVSNGSARSPGTGGSGGGVTSVAQTVPSWLTVTGSPVTTSGTLAIAPTTAQTSHQVIGTCGTATTFAPCALVAGDMPTAIPIANIGSAGLSGSTGISIASTGAISQALTFDSTSTGLTTPAGNASWTFPTTNSLTIGQGTPVASTPNVTISGAPFTTGNATTNFPMFYLNCSGSSGPTTLGTSGTIFGINTCSGFAGNFIDYHINGGPTKFLVGNSGNINMAARITNYNGLVGVGESFCLIVGSTSQKAETGADTSLLTITPPATAGGYKAHIVMSVSAASAAVLGWTATYTDSNGNAQTPTNLALLQNGTAVPALTFTVASGTSNLYGDFYFDINNAAAAITIKTTFTGTSVAYKASATICEQQ